MNSKTLLGILLLIAALPFSGLGQQSGSGKIVYDITYQRRTGGGTAQPDNAPREFTRKSALVFNNTNGKWEAAENNNRKKARSGSTYLDFQKKQYLRTFKKQGNDTTFFIVTPFKEAEDFQLTGKTKRLLGYNCQEATAKFRNQDITLWFTKDISLAFSPVNGLVPPDGGVVLEMNSRRMHVLATATDQDNVAEKQLVIPQPSRQISREEVRHMYQERHRKHRGKKSDNK